MSHWRVLWYKLWPDEDPDDAVAASMDEIERHCAPFPDDPFLVIALFQHRHGQIVDLSIGEWLERHGEALRKHLGDANRASARLYVAAGTANTAARSLEGLGQKTVDRVTQALGTLETAERDMRSQAFENRSVYRAIREHMAWTRPALLILLTASLGVSGMVSAFLAKQAFASKPGEALWMQLSEAERRDLPAFITSGALSDVMKCRVAGFRIAEGRCVPDVRRPLRDDDGWTLPEAGARDAGRRWSSEGR